MIIFMKKGRQLIICGLLVWLTALAGVSLAHDSDFSTDARTVLRSASELDYPPFAIVRPDGTADGFSVDLLKAVVKVN